MSRWYIIHAYSGFENKVRDQIMAEATRLGLDQLVESVEVPTEKVTEVRRGKKVTSDRKFFPGYVLAKLNMNDDVYHLVKNTPKVTGFLGSSGKPQPISDAEEEEGEQGRHDDDHQPGHQRLATRRPDDLGRLRADLPKKFTGIDSRHAQTVLHSLCACEIGPSSAFVQPRLGLFPLPCPAKRNRRSGDHGRSGGTRTPGPRFWRPMLYQLSYTPKSQRRRP